MQQAASLACDFDSCWQAFVRVPSLRIIREHLRKSIRLTIDLQQSHPATFNDVRSFLLGCISETAVPDLEPTQYDCRYFFRDAHSGSGRCLGGLVRDTVAMLLREMAPFTEWMPPHYLYSAIAGSRNPSVRGFLVEQACIHALLTTPVEYTPGLQLRPSEVRFFDTGSEADALVNDAFCVLYAPRAFNYKAVDAVLRILPAHANSAAAADVVETVPGRLQQLQQACSAVLVPVQITLSSVKKHEASVAAFFASRAVWLSHVIAADGSACGDADAQWVFHWIVPKAEADQHAHAREDKDAQQLRTRSGVRTLTPKHAVLIRAIEQLTGKPDLLRSPPSSPSKTSKK